MKQFGIAGLWLALICIGGCAGSLPPHEELNQALKKSFDANGLNYSSKSRITNLTIPKEELPSDSSGTVQKYLGTGFEVIRGLSLNANGAIDMKAKKSEVLYDVRYDKDNVEVSIKIPLLMDYSTQTIYVGPSLLNTILEIAYPQIPPAKGRMFKINLNELLRESAANSPELAKLLGENRFSPQSIDAWNGAVRTGILKSLAKLNDATISVQPLNDADKRAGLEKRIRVVLNHDDSVAVALDLVEGISQNLYQEGLLSEKELALLRIFTDKEQLESILQTFTLKMTFDTGIAASGFITQMESQIELADSKGAYQLGINNLSAFSNYNSPQFSMKPETSGIVDIKEILDVIMADSAKTPKNAPPVTDDSEEDDTPEETDQKNI